MISHTENRDCMEVMREFPDGYFDLAIDGVLRDELGVEIT